MPLETPFATESADWPVKECTCDLRDKNAQEAYERLEAEHGHRVAAAFDVLLATRQSR